MVCLIIIMNFQFTDIQPDREDQYDNGWITVGLFGLVFLSCYGLLMKEIYERLRLYIIKYGVIMIVRKYGIDHYLVQPYRNIQPPVVVLEADVALKFMKINETSKFGGLNPKSPRTPRAKMRNLAVIFEVSG